MRWRSSLHVAPPIEHWLRQWMTSQKPRSRRMKPLSEPDTHHHLGGRLDRGSDPRADQTSAAGARPADGGSIPDAYWRLARIWAIMCIIATVIPGMSARRRLVRPWGIAAIQARRQ